MTIALKRFTSDDGAPPWFDVLLKDGDLVSDEGLEAAVALSLFLDRRAENDDVTDDDDRRGWWADGIDGDNDLIGSRLWLLERSKTQPDVPGKTERYAEEALAWMIEDGVAKAVYVTAERVGNNMLKLHIDIRRPDGRVWEHVWEVQLNAF